MCPKTSLGCLLYTSRDRIVLVGMNRRYIPLVRRVLERFGQLSDIHHVECTFLKHSDASFYGGCESANICDTIHSIDLLSYIADSDPQNAATLIDTIDSPIDNSWNSIIRFRNGRTGILKGGYRSGGRIHTVEIHGSCASAYLNLGFGGAECSAKILHHEGTSSFSPSSAGAATYNIEAFDGKEIAGSGEYWNYYGCLLYTSSLWVISA